MLESIRNAGMSIMLTMKEQILQIEAQYSKLFEEYSRILEENSKLHCEIQKYKPQVSTNGSLISEEHIGNNSPKSSAPNSVPASTIITQTSNTNSQPAVSLPVAPLILTQTTDIPAVISRSAQASSIYTANSLPSIVTQPHTPVTPTSTSSLTSQ